MTNNRSRYKLIALDLDGTIVGRDLTISPQCKSAIRRAEEAGVRVTIASGRMLKSTLRFARELGVRTPIICYQGAMTADPATGEIMWHRPVPLDLAYEVIGMFKARSVHINLYVNDELYVDRITKEAERYAKLSIVEAHPVGDLLAFLNSEPTKIVAIGDMPVIDALTTNLEQEYDSRLYITKSFPTYCEVAHRDCSKGQALARLAESLGIAQEETIAIGDNPNDLDMITWAGLGVAMGNGAPEVRAVADWVTGTVDDSGAAQAIEKALGLSAHSAGKADLDD
ncbi:MAG: Cof-type HAD-IIB family hydrolase [Dehalococcoidia bacterium]|nr:Cof-type HAD-IIB family hydrolase [Dehalococcoidia bacterium]